MLKRQRRLSSKGLEVFGHPFVGDSNQALERNAREARHPPLTNIHRLEDRPPKIFKGESADIIFRERESRWVHHPNNDALVITILIGAINVHRVFLDNGSSVNILYYSTYKKLGFPDSDMNFEDAHIYGFTGEAVRVMGSVRIPVTLGEGAMSITQMIDFKVLDQDSAHNVRRYEGKGLPFEDATDIQTKPGGKVLAHYFVKDPEDKETHATEAPALTLENVSRIRSVEVYAPLDAGIEVKDPRDFDFDLVPRIPMPAEKTGPAEDTIYVPVDKDNPSKVLKVGSQLSYEMRGRLTNFLIKNLDVFAWSHSDMVGIDPGHRSVNGERTIALKKEVDRLLEVGLIKEPFYPEWLVNTVLVKKPNGKWRTCVDFTDLNKACPKDSFLLPRIDQLVDVMEGHALLSFMDAYSSYNQIPIYSPDQEHTSFITDRGLYCYIGMPLGLINTGATYQRLVNMMFKNQIGRTMEVYVDDMLVKSKEANDHVKHLMKMFNILRRFHMRLNPQKCVFDVESGKFLGFIVNHREIEANPGKIKALLDMKSPTNVKQVQSLTGRIATLNRFVSKSSDGCKEFFKAIKVAGKDFVLTPECEEAFRRIKEQLGNPSMLSKPLDGESLILYLTVSNYSISAVLEATPYFQAHKIEVRTAYPLRQVLHKPESSGRILKWAVELGQFDLEYMPHTAINGQALINFLLEFDSAVDDKALVVLHPLHTEESLEEFPHPWWILHVDGAVNNGGARAGIVLVSPEGHHLMSAIHFKFYAMDNDADYEALINGLRSLWKWERGT
ncbi:uncharacterized protein LOC141660358 [Apium graveolens]|uniref:uncharacterized protein LOC141660358 n=1 Tax=Apium graveolens TaxID=4045 RepID=UPI003D7B0644